MSNLYADYHASTFFFCKQMVGVFAAAGLGSPEIFKFDAHADLNEMPASDVIGPMEFSLESDDGMQSVMCMFAVSTLNDLNITRLDAMINIIYDRLQPGNTLNLVSAVDGAQRGYLKVMNGTQALQVLNTTTRPVKAVAVQFGSDVPRGL